MLQCMTVAKPSQHPEMSLAGRTLNARWVESRRQKPQARRSQTPGFDAGCIRACEVYQNEPTTPDSANERNRLALYVEP